MFELPHSILSIALATVLLPSISNFIVNKDFTSALTVQRKSLLYCLYFIIPVTLFFIIYPELFVASLFQRGNFDTYATRETSILLSGFAVGMPAYSLSVILTPYFFATKKLKTLFYLSSSIILLNIIVIYFFQNYYGYRAITYGLSVSTWVFTISLIYLMYKYNFKFIDRETTIIIIKILIFNLFLFIFLYLECLYLNKFINSHLILTIILIISGMFLYLVITYFFEKNFIKKMLQAIRFGNEN